MNRRALFAGALLAAIGTAMPAGPTFAQQSADVEAAKAASKAFYQALSTGVEPMLAIYAKTPYVFFIGPGMKTPSVGWDDVKKSIENSWTVAVKRSVAITASRMEVRGTLAWETGNEIGTVTGKDGAERKVDVIVTNVYEKIDGKWLMVSHHAQPKPQ